MERKPVPVLHPLDMATGEPPSDAGVAHERLIAPVGVLVAGGGADAPIRQGPMGPRVTVGSIRPALGRPAAASAPRPGAGRLEVPDGVVTSPVAPAEGAAYQGVAAIPAVPSSTEVGEPVGVVPLVVVAAEVAHRPAPPSLGRARGFVTTAAAPAGGRAPAEAPAASDGAEPATTARAGSPGVPYDGACGMGDVPGRVEDGETPRPVPSLPILGGGAPGPSGIGGGAPAFPDRTRRSSYRGSLGTRTSARAPPKGHTLSGVGRGTSFAACRANFP